jgi:uncharacterized delta-60 repeat protein
MADSPARVLAFFLALLVINSAVAHPPEGTDTSYFQKFCRHPQLPFRLRYLGTPGVHLEDQKNNSLRTAPIQKGTSMRSPSALPPEVHLTAAAGESIGVAWARHFSSGLVPSSDYPNAMAADSSGNIYVTGVSEKTYSDGDFVTLKYDHKGNLQWEARYSNPINGYSEPLAIAVDSFHNVYVTGYTTNQTTGQDLLTVKYDSSGNQLWLQTFQGSSDSSDVAVAIGIDNAGNCYILGYSYNTASDYDIVLLSYASTGAERWEKFYDGSAHGVDMPTGLSIGKNGTVCFTGTTNGTIASSDIITIQYDLQGTEQWRAVYATPGIDYSTGIITDDSGYVTVAGYSGANNLSTSFLLLQYTSTGSVRWTSLYNGSHPGTQKTTGLVLDNAENILVTGIVTSNGSVNYLTIKYNRSSGGILWEEMYDNSYHGNDYAIGMAISTEGHIYVTGYSQFSTSTSYAFLTVEYDSAGKQLMADRYVPNGSDAIPTAIIRDNNTDVFVCGPIIANSYDMEILKYSYYQRGQISFTLDLGTDHDDLGAMTTDRFGRLYICGSNGQSIVVSRYDNDLNLQWQAVLPNLTDAAVVACNLDRQQNIALAGYTRNANGDFDILTAFVSSDGNILWVRTYNGPDSGDDRAVAMTIDHNGGMIVTGTSYSPNTFNDIVTLKYSSDGVVRWVTRYNNRSYNHDDLPAAIALDKEENIYITGNSVRLNTSNDILTLKYDTSGVQQWVNFYNGPGDGSDYGRAIVIDTNDAIYVTGKIYAGETSSTVVLLRYSTTGQLVWASSYIGNEIGDNEPTAMVLDPTGCPVIAGMTYHSLSNFDFLTLKYDSSGTLLWKGEYDAAAAGIDYAVSLTTDAVGDVYVTGNSVGSGSGIDIATLKYDMYGSLQWVQRYNGNSSLNDQAVGIAIDSSANVFVGGTSYSDVTGNDIVVIKYLFPPLESWPVRYDGPGTSGDVTSAVAIDNSGNVYLAGQSETANISILCTTLKFDQGGDQLWKAFYSGSFNTFNIGKDISLMSDGSPVVTGYDQEIGAPSFNYLTIQYSPDGTTTWVKTFNAINSNYNFAMNVAVGWHQSVYVSGYTYNNITQYDFTTVKYSPTGVQLWAAQYNDSLNDNDLMTAMVVDRFENVCVTGISGNGLHSTNYATVKYDSTGSRRWAAIYDGPAHFDDRPTAIATDSMGNVFVTGWSMGLATDHDIVTIKYDSSGMQRWVATYDGPASNRDDATSIAVDNAGSIYVAGTSYNADFTNPDYVLLKYDPQGNEEWVRRYDGPSSSDDILKKMILDTAGNIYLTGTSTGSNGISDIITLKYDSAGNLRWNARVHEPDYSNAAPADIAVDKDGNVVLAGTSSGKTWSVITAIQYRQRTTDAVSDRMNVPSRYSLFQNYPNPFNSSTLFTYSLAERSYVRLEIYDILGQRVTSLINTTQAPGKYQVSYDGGRLTTGTYFYKLDAIKSSPKIGENKIYTDVKKMILMK